MDNNEVKLINIRQVLRQKAPSASRKIPDFLVNYLIRLVHQDELNDIILRYQDKEGVEFMESLIRYFDLTLQVHGDIPESGRYLFVSNHPLGGMDGICLSALIGRKYDGKIRYLVNDLLLYLRNLQSIFVPINKHGAQSKENALRIEEAYASDNQIITFPAGLCSRKIKGKIVDLEWKKSFVQKAVQYQRDVVPVYFDGQIMKWSTCRTKCSVRSIRHSPSILENLFPGRPSMPDANRRSGQIGSSKSFIV